jgi:RNA polymerase sigma-70 factor (ECF subfamily)
LRLVPGRSREQDRAAKRGGRATIVSIHAADAEGRYCLEPAGNETPDRLFDRAWALTLLDSIFSRLPRE